MTKCLHWLSLLLFLPLPLSSCAQENAAAPIAVLAQAGGSPPDGGKDPPIEGSNRERILDAIAAALGAGESISTAYEPCVEVECPADPITTNEVNVDTQRELNAAMVSGNKINVAAGSYSNLLCTDGQHDIDIVLDDDASFSEAIFIDDCNKMRVTGGEFEFITLQTSPSPDSVTHVLFDNVVTREGVHCSNFGTVAPGHHIAFLNMTAGPSSSDYAFFCVDVDHLIVARSNIRANVPSGGGAGIAAARLVTLENSLFVGNCFHTISNRMFRVHADHGDTRLMGVFANLFSSGSGGHNLWWGPSAGGAADGIYDVEFRYNSYYSPDSGISGFVAQTDSSNGDGIHGFITRDNDFHSPDRAPFTGNRPSGYTESGNTFGSYGGGPPPCTVGANH